MASLTVKNEGTFGIDCKRFYFGAIITGECPACGKDFRRDFTEDYLSYPSANCPIDVHLCCQHEDCEHQWTVTAQLNVSLALL